MCSSDCFLAILAIFFPPLAVWVKRGLCSVDSVINIALCMLGFIPGLLHAWYIISITPDPTYEEVEDAERGTVTYYYVQGQPQYAPGGGRQAGQSQAQRQPQTYGTVNSTPNSQFHGRQNGFVQPQPSAAAGPSNNEVPPPTYQDAVSGDNKIQHS